MTGSLFRFLTRHLYPAELDGLPSYADLSASDLYLSYLSSHVITPYGVPPVVTHFSFVKLSVCCNHPKDLLYYKIRLLFIKWCGRWDSNPQNSGFESDTYTNSITSAWS